MAQLGTSASGTGIIVGSGSLENGRQSPDSYPAISVSNTSSLSLVGTASALVVAKSLRGNGIDVLTGSYLMGANIVSSSNGLGNATGGGHGINVDSGSSAFLYGDITASSNKYSGVMVARALLHTESATCTFNSNSQHGIAFATAEVADLWHAQPSMLIVMGRTDYW